MAEQPEQFPGDFPGTIGVPPDVPRLVAASDVVCLGRVMGLSEEGEARYLIGSEEYAFERVVASVRVERTFKGPPELDTIEVAFLRLDLPTGLIRLEEGQRRVLFLRRDGDRYRLADAGTGTLDPSAPTGDVRQALEDAREAGEDDVARIAEGVLAEVEG